jgi:hypothetical protein
MLPSQYLWNILESAIDDLSNDGDIGFLGAAFVGLE